MNTTGLAEGNSQQKISFLNILVCRVLLVLISWYQWYISPYKGFSCAHRVVHGGESCSCYVKRTILEQDLITTISMSQKRFRECASANKVLMAKNSAQFANVLKTVISEERNQKGQAGLFRRLRFIQGGILGFIMPISIRRGSCNSSCSLCLSSFENEEERQKKDN